MSRYKPQHARRHHYRWQPWAKWLHLLAATFGLLVGSAQTAFLVNNFVGQLLIDFGYAFVVYAAMAIVGGYLISIVEADA